MRAIRTKFSDGLQFGAFSKNYQTVLPVMMRKLPLLPFIFLVAYLPVSGQTHPRPLPVNPMPVPTITFLPNPGATSVRQVNPGNAAVDFGTVAFAAKHAPIVSTQFSIRIDGVSYGSGHAIVWAFLEDPDPSVTIRIDGVRLSAVPQVVESQAVFGIPSGHSLYFEIPVSAPAGRIDRTIRWEVTQS